VEERLQKIIARAGISSRRRAEDLIRAGAVTVNGAMVTELGSKADAARDHIKVNGKLLRFVDDKKYVLLHKPAGVVSTLHDPEGRECLAKYARWVPGRVFPVGRLEYHAQGLLLLTNDGELANALLQEKLAWTDWLKVKGKLTPEAIENVQAQTGVRLRMVKEGANAWYEARFAAGRSKEDEDRVQKALLRGGHPVEKLRRVALGPLTLGNLPAGKFRVLEGREVAALWRQRRRNSSGKEERTLRVRGKPA
jgi:23S rRNA pseudouridine2605 synthase